MQKLVNKNAALYLIYYQEMHQLTKFCYRFVGINIFVNIVLVHISLNYLTLPLHYSTFISKITCWRQHDFNKNNLSYSISLMQQYHILGSGRNSEEIVHVEIYLNVFEETVMQTCLNTFLMWILMQLGMTFVPSGFSIFYALNVIQVSGSDPCETSLWYTSVMRRDTTSMLVSIS